MKNHTHQATILNYKNIILPFVFLVFSNFLLAQNKTIPSGSVIINMGIVPQTYGNALKPYGLVYNFLTVQKVPVIWSINPTKVKDGVDFTVDGINFKGGPFIIEKQFAIVPSVQAAIASFVTQGLLFTLHLLMLRFLFIKKCMKIRIGLWTPIMVQLLQPI